jgi:hypothetical protein
MAEKIALIEGVPRFFGLPLNRKNFHLFAKGINTALILKAMEVYPHTMLNLRGLISFKCILKQFSGKFSHILTDKIVPMIKTMEVLMLILANEINSVIDIISSKKEEEEEEEEEEEDAIFPKKKMENIIENIVDMLFLLNNAVDYCRKSLASLTGSLRIQLFILFGMRDGKIKNISDIGSITARLLEDVSKQVHYTGINEQFREFITIRNTFSKMMSEMDTIKKIEVEVVDEAGKCKKTLEQLYLEILEERGIKSLEITQSITPEIQKEAEEEKERILQRLNPPLLLEFQPSETTTNEGRERIVFKVLSTEIFGDIKEIILDSDVKIDDMQLFLFQREFLHTGSSSLGKVSQKGSDDIIRELEPEQSMDIAKRYHRRCFLGSPASFTKPDGSWFILFEINDERCRDVRYVKVELPPTTSLDVINPVKESLMDGWDGLLEDPARFVVDGKTIDAKVYVSSQYNQGYSRFTLESLNIIACAANEPPAYLVAPPIQAAEPAEVTLSALIEAERRVDVELDEMARGTVVPGFGGGV